MVEKFKYSNLEELKKECKMNDINIDFSKDVSVLKKPLKINGKTLKNRLAVQPMEGFDSDSNHAPGELTFRRYKRYAEGGAALIVIEATAVRKDGITNPHQLLINDDNINKFKELVDMIRKTALDKNNINPYLVLQLTHSGRFSKPDGSRKPIVVVHEPHLDQKVAIDSDYELVTDQYLDDLQDDFIKAAAAAENAGFDAVDIKACHKYLISELLGARQRTGKYGGSYENRTRFLKDILKKINDSNLDIDLNVRLNLSDYFNSPNSWGVDYQSLSNEIIIDLSEPKKLVGELIDLGLKVLNTSAGTPYYNSHVNRPFDQAVVNGYQPPENQLYGVERLFNLTAEIQQSFSELPVMGAGYSWLREFGVFAAAANIKNGNQKIAGFGRQSFAYPDFANDILEKGKMETDKCCISCSRCSQLMIWGSKTGCVVRDAKLYAPIYQQRRKEIEG